MEFSVEICRYGSVMFPTQSLQKLRGIKIGLKSLEITLLFLVVGPSLRMGLFIILISSRMLVPQVTKSDMLLCSTHLIFF